MILRVVVNGASREADVEPRLLLSDFLRHGLGLTGTHVGCEHGVCGACTILFDGEPARSCIMLAVQADGHAIQTVEGLSPDGVALNPLQAAFRDAHGLQCGFCTPGILMTLSAFLRDNPAPVRARGSGRAFRQSLPVHRLPAHRRGRRPCQPKPATLTRGFPATRTRAC